ncbi:3-phosphoshikimate 1-carboxyvinyltransferase [Candidatus Vidania fulgoroideorum]
MNIFFLKKFNKKNIIKNIYGSKSISNRILLISSFCKNKVTVIKNLSNSEDTKIMINFLLNIDIKIYKKNCNLYVLGNLKKIRKKKIFLKNAGTVVRPIFFLSNFFTKKYINITGNLSMHKRTISELYNISKYLNGTTIFNKNSGYLPSKNLRSKLKYKKIKVNCKKSSQYASSLLMVLNIFNVKNLLVLYNISSYFYITLTLKIIKLFGIKVKLKKYKDKIYLFTIGKYDSCKKVLVENDFSSISYFFLKSFFIKKISKFTSYTRKIHQGEIKILNCLNKIGMNIFIKNNIFFFYVSNKKVRNLEVNCIDIPDSSISILLLILNNIERIKLFNIRSWNFKESNRILSTSCEFKRIGTKIKFGKNWIIIKKRFMVRNFFLKTHNDHRILMCFSILRIFFKNFYICNPNCVKKTFENYIFEMFSN